MALNGIWLGEIRFSPRQSSFPANPQRFRALLTGPVSTKALRIWAERPVPGGGGPEARPPGDTVKVSLEEGHEQEANRDREEGAQGRGAPRQADQAVYATERRDPHGFKCPAMAALKIAERRGYKVTTNKVPGELTRYIARKA